LDKRGPRFQLSAVFHNEAKISLETKFFNTTFENMGTAFRKMPAYQRRQALAQGE
jgi:hypothetical protein